MGQAWPAGDPLVNRLTWLARRDYLGVWSGIAIGLAVVHGHD
jgi:hypothetical protein